MTVRMDDDAPSTFGTGYGADTSGPIVYRIRRRRMHAMTAIEAAKRAGYDITGLAPSHTAAYFVWRRKP